MRDTARKWDRKALLGTVAALAVLPGAAWAQAEKDNRIEEVVVTAQKRAQSNIEVPISMTVIAPAEIEALRAESISDVALTVPNLTFYKASPFDVAYSIRGISGKTGGQFDPVGVTVDGISYGLVDTSLILTARFLDVERIEVLRGPQGTLTSNNSMGGVINVITAAPDPSRLSYRATLDYSRFNTTFAKGVLNVPLNSALSARAVVYGVTGDGAVKNVGPAGGDSGENSYGGRLALRFTPNDRLTVDLSGAYEVQHIGIDTAMPVDRYVGGSAARTSAINQYAALGGNYFGGEFLENTGNNGGIVRLDFPEYTHVRNEMASLHGSYRLDHHTIDLTYSRYDVHLQNAVDQDQTEFALTEFTRTHDERSDGVDLRVTSNYTGPLNWVAGLSYNRDESPETNVSLTGDGKRGGAYNTLRFKFAQTQNIDSKGIYLNGFWDITKKLHLTAGVRYNDLTSEYGSVTVLTGGLGAVVPPYPLTRASLKTTAPRVALNYDIADHASVYATYATGFRAGFGNLSSAVGHHATTIGTLDIPADVRNETVANYEVGAKGLFLDGRLSVNAAAFYMDYKDLQVRAGLVTDANQPGLAFNLNAGKAYARGFELETAARPLDGLELRFDVGYVDTKILNLNNVALTSTDIPAVRPWTTDTTAIYEFPLPRGLTARLRADYVWQAHTYVSLVRNPGTEFPKFGVANLQATIENDRWSATAYIDNAFSKAYWFVTGADGTLSGDIGQFIPRTFGVRFTIKE